MKLVTVKNRTLGDGQPKICIPITAKNRDELRIQTEMIKAAPCDMAEWRADYYAQECDGAAWRASLSEALSFLRAQLPDKPLLFTFRTKEEGGERSIPLEEYRSLNEWAAASGKIDLVDLELNRGEELLRGAAAAIQKYGAAVIGSFHDFAETPEKGQIIDRLCRMQVLGADITKAAVMPRSGRDVLTLLDASLDMKEKYADRPFITMSMGPLGAVSRLSGSLTGSAVTFAAVGRASAPGQMDAELVARVLRS